MTDYPTIDSKLQVLRDAIRDGVKPGSLRELRLLELLEDLEEQIAREIKDAAPVADSAPSRDIRRYDWTASGMKQSETGNWVMAEKGDKA
jgi:hypothetical protein